MNFVSKESGKQYLHPKENKKKMLAGGKLAEKRMQVFPYREMEV